MTTTYAYTCAACGAQVESGKEELIPAPFGVTGREHFTTACPSCHRRTLRPRRIPYRDPYI